MDPNPPAACLPIWATVNPVLAAEHAIAVNPANDPAFHAPIQAGVGGVGDVLEPQRLAVLTGKKWPVGKTLRVGFTGGSPAVIDKCLMYFREWSKTAYIDFDHATTDLDMLVAFNLGGYWSGLGADCKQMVAGGHPSMSLQGFDREMPLSEWRRVVTHEPGHGLAFPHEHMAPEIREDLDPQACYREFGGAPNWWSKQTIDQNILNPPQALDWWQGTIERNSIMCYSFAARLTKSGRAIEGGSFLTEADRQFAALCYPGRLVKPPEKPPVVPPPPDSATLAIGGDGARLSLPPGSTAVYRFTSTKAQRVDVSVILRDAGGAQPIATLGQPGGGKATLWFDRNGAAKSIKIVAGEYDLKVRHPLPNRPLLCWAKVDRT